MLVQHTAVQSAPNQPNQFNRPYQHNQFDKAEQHSAQYKLADAATHAQWTAPNQLNSFDNHTNITDLTCQITKLTNLILAH